MHGDQTKRKPHCFMEEVKEGIKKNCANFGNGSGIQICYHNLGAFMFIGIQVNGILKKSALVFH